MMWRLSLLAGRASCGAHTGRPVRSTAIATAVSASGWRADPSQRERPEPGEVSGRICVAGEESQEPATRLLLGRSAAQEA